MNIDLLIERVLLSRLHHAMTTGTGIEAARQALRAFYETVGMY